MEKKLLYGVAIVAVAAVGMILVMKFLPSTTSVASEAVILSELQRLNMVTTGQPTQTEMQLPSDLSGPNWGLKAIVCQEGGYDIPAYAGKAVLLTSYPINQVYDGKEPLQVWVITSGNKIVCVYRSVREGSTLVSGIFSVKENPLITLMTPFNTV